VSTEGACTSVKPKVEVCMCMIVCTLPHPTARSLQRYAALHYSTRLHTLHYSTLYTTTLLLHTTPHSKLLQLRTLYYSTLYRTPHSALLSTLCTLHATLLCTIYTLHCSPHATLYTLHGTQTRTFVSSISCDKSLVSISATYGCCWCTSDLWRMRSRCRK
jgi:hypothetical protein